MILLLRSNLAFQSIQTENGQDFKLKKTYYKCHKNIALTLL